MSYGYRLWIVNNATGEGRWYEDRDPWQESYEYLWTDGNFGCDCNRHTFWNNSDGEEDFPCGHTAYSVPYVELPDGRRIEIDGSDVVTSAS